MRRHKIVFFVAAVFLLGSVTVFAAGEDSQAPTGGLTGFLYKKDGVSPLQNASLELRKVIRYENKIKYDKTIYQSNKTDESGEYRIADLTVGEYLVKIKIGKKLYNVGKIDFFVTIVEGESNKISFSLLKRR